MQVSANKAFRESVDVAFGDVAFQICENGVFKEKNVRLNSAGCEPHSRSDECFLFENPIFTLLKRHVRKRHVYRLPIRAYIIHVYVYAQDLEALKPPHI